MRRILPPSLFLFTLFLGGSLLLTGCGDELLPPEDSGETEKKSFFIVDREDRRAVGIIPVDEEGNAGERISFDDRLDAPPSATGLVAIVESRKVRIVDIESHNTVGIVAALENEGISQAAISPDGSRIAFTAITPVADTSQRYLHLIDVDGNNRVVVDVGSGFQQHLRFSPDGSQVAFFDGLEDQDKIVFGRGGEWDDIGILYVVSAEDGSKKEVARSTHLGADGAVQIEWSPDGSRIIYQDYADSETTWIVDVETAEKTLLIDGPSLAEWSPDGSRIILVGEEGMFLYDANDVSSHRSVPVDLPLYYPHWIDNDRIIGYQVDPALADFDVDQNQLDLVMVDVETGETEVLLADQDVWFIFDNPVAH